LRRLLTAANYLEATRCHPPVVNGLQPERIRISRVPLDAALAHRSSSTLAILSTIAALNYLLTADALDRGKIDDLTLRSLSDANRSRFLALTSHRDG